MNKQNKQALDELLETAERISKAKISESMKDVVFQHFLKTVKLEPLDKWTNSERNGHGKNEDIEFNSTITRFMRTYKIANEQLKKLFYLEPDNIDYLIPKLKVKNNVEGIHHCILLVGLKNALETSKYTVVVNQVRELANNHGVYDSPNFSYAMSKNESLLKNYKPGKDSELSGAGIRAASDLVSKLSQE